MNEQRQKLTIDDILNELKINSRGQIRNKSKVTDKLHATYLTVLDNELMDIRVFVAKLPIATSVKNTIDEFIYKKQVL